MGGSSGGRPLFSPEDIKKLQETARQTIKDEAATVKRNIFISFASEDLNDVNLLRGQAKNDRNDLEFNDWSLKSPYDSENAEYIKRGIRERIRQSSITICYVSEHTAASKWVDWEIRESVKLGKEVFCVHKGTTLPAVLPPAVKELKIRTVAWDHKKIVQEIDSAYARREQSQ